MKPWSLVHRGRVEAAGLWIDVALVGQPEARARVVALWRAGARVYELDRGLLLRFQAVRTVLAEGAGTPLVERQNTLIAAPLRDLEWEARPEGAVILVRAGAARGFELPAPVDPASWLRIELPRADVVACAPPPTVGSTSRRVVDVGRGTFGVPEVSPEAAELLSSLAGEPLPAAPPPPAEPSWFSRWFGAPAAPAEGRAPSGPASSGLFAGLGTFLERMVGGGLQDVGLESVVHRRQQAQLQALMERFGGDLEEALRHAIPLGGKGLGPSHPALRVPGPRERLSPDLRGGGGGGGSFGAAPELYQLLLATYRKAAEQLIEAGAIEKAAFVYADLLGELDEALRLLEAHERYELAAKLAESRGQPAAQVARLWVLAGDVARALKIARVQRVFGELLASFSGKDDTLLRAAYAADLVSIGLYRAGVDVLWPSALRPATRPWLELLVQSEEGLGDALVQLAELDLEAAEVHFDDRVLRAEAVELRQRVCRSMVREGAPRSWGRRLARAMIADDGQPGFDPAPMQALLQWPELADLRVDVPAFGRVEPHPPGQLRIEASAAGGMPIRDLARVHAGTLCALGEGGLVLLDALGTPVWRDPTPCSSLVPDAEGFRAVGLHPSGTVQRLVWIDLRGRTVVPWVDTELARWAGRTFHGHWLVATATHAVAIDLVASLAEGTLKWAWKGPALEGPVLAIEQGRTESWLAIGGELNERWRYDDLWFLRGREPLPQPFEYVFLGGARYAGLTGTELLVDDGGLRRTELAPGTASVLVTPCGTWFAEPDPHGMTVTTGPRAARSVRLEGATAAGLRWREPHWLGIHDDRGRLLWLDAVSGRVDGPHRV